MNTTQWGWAKQTDDADFEGCRPPCTSGSAMNSQWCQMFFEQSTPFNLSLSLSLLFSVSPSPHLFVHFFYLFKAEIYGLYQAWKGKQMLQLTKKITGFYFTAVYLFILGICFLFFFFFFGRNKKSFSIPKGLSLFFLSYCLNLLLKLQRKSTALSNVL